MKKTIDYYLNLPYAIKIVRLEDGDYFAQFDEKELNKKVLMSGDGQTADAAIADLKAAFACYLETALSDGEIIPEPKREKTKSWAVSIKESLAQKIDKCAKELGISRSALISRGMDNYLATIK